MSTITGTRIDEVLQRRRGVGSGAERRRDGGERGRADLRGRGGPAGGRRAGPGDGGHAVPDRVDDEDGHDHRGAAAGRAGQAGPRRAGREVPAGVRGPAGARRLRRRRRRACAHPKTQGHRAPARHATPPAWATGSGTPTSCAGRRRRARQRRSPATADIFTAPLVADPGTTLRVRHQHGLARPGRRGGERPDAGRLLRRAHPRPLGMEQTTFHHQRRAARRTCPRSTCAARTARWEATERRLDAAARLVGRRPRPVLPRRATTCASSGCCSTAARSTARRSSRPRRSTPRSPTRSATSTSRRRSRPPSRPRRADFNAGPGYKFGLGLLLQHRGRAGHARAPAAAPGRASSTPTSGSTATTGVTGAIYTADAPVRRAPVFQVYIDFEQALYASLDVTAQRGIGSRRA